MRRTLLTVASTALLLLAAAPVEASAAHVDLDLHLDGYGRCGWTCGEVSATLSNSGDAAAHDVTSVTSVYAGNDLIWRGSRTVGDLGPGAPHSAKERIDVGLVDLIRIKINGGWITFEVIVESREDRQVFGNRVKVL
ncbi:MAG: hypothetical protein MAG715_00768 [Methanonatronarchaeales archaeon]|nr:hypothetical protein [Methanonatronarchaeales archaeon]